MKHLIAVSLLAFVVIILAAYLTLPESSGAVPPSDPCLIDRLLPLIAQAESSGNPSAMGDDGKSVGLYQIGPGLLHDFNILHRTDYHTADIFDPALNERIARWHLARLNSRLASRGLSENIPCLIYAYNFGWSRLAAAGYAVPASALNHKNLIYRALLRGEWPEVKS